MTLRVLYVDFNSYFASVEQQENPKLRGKPVAVVPVVADTTCCIAASYEAKRFGIKTGTRVADARRKCPGIIFVNGQHETYVAYHHRLIAAVDACAPVAKVHSIDEMAVELPTRWRSVQAAREVAERIKQSIRDRVGEHIKCSIGIGPNTFLAKTASDLRKPDGLTVIELKDLPQALHRLALRDLTGIGPNMERRLRARGITTVAALCKASAEGLRKAWGGVGGAILHAQLRGLEAVEEHREQITLSHSHVLPPHLRNDTDARAVAHRMLQKAAMRLRKNHLAAGGLRLSVRLPAHGRWSSETHFGATQDSGGLTQVLDTLWDQRTPASAPVAVGVTLIQLTTEDAASLPLFAAPLATAPPPIAQTVDGLNKRHGKSALYLGAARRAVGAAPMRIAFNRIPDVEVER
ncbi:MAG: DNA-directed DNA polymerase [Pseudomonadota bacterium]